MRDAFSRVCVGWHLSTGRSEPLVLSAFEQAVLWRQPQPGLILHSDRGSQSSCLALSARLPELQALGSMSRTGHPDDNAFAESLLGTVKREEVSCHSSHSLQQAQERLTQFFQTSNTIRLHSSLGSCPPLEFEASSQANHGP